MRKQKTSTPFLMSLFAMLLACSSHALATEEAGTVKTLKGTATIERNGNKTPAIVGSRILASDRISTGAESSIGITLRDNTLLSAGPNAVLELKQFAFNPTTHAGTIDATVQRGSLGVVSGKIAKASPEQVRFNTPSVSLGVRGTEFILEAGKRDNTEE